jgi:hypothetical protein
MKNKAYFIKNLARIKNLSEDDPWIVQFHDKQIVDILLAIKEARSRASATVTDGEDSDDLWDRLSNGRI